MSFSDVLHAAPLLLTEGALIERLRRDSSVALDPQVLHAGFVYERRGRERLCGLWRQYLDTGREHHLPMLIQSPTWRANPERLAVAGLGGRDVNGNGVRLCRTVRAEYGDYAASIFVAGLIGCRGDAYRPQEALRKCEAAEFHASQLRALAAAGVDLLMAATLPALSEAMGIAEAMAATGLPFLLSFVIPSTGELLDGTPLEDAVRIIDRSTHPQPAGYLVNCVHPTVFARAVASRPALTALVPGRVLGLQGNTALLSPEELESLDHLEETEPRLYGEQMRRLHEWFGLKILGGCCGTDERHIAAIATQLTADMSL